MYAFPLSVQSVSAQGQPLPRLCACGRLAASSFVVCASHRPPGQPPAVGCVDTLHTWCAWLYVQYAIWKKQVHTTAGPYGMSVRTTRKRGTYLYSCPHSVESFILYTYTGHQASCNFWAAPSGSGISQTPPAYAVRLRMASTKKQSRESNGGKRHRRGLQHGLPEGCAGPAAGPIRWI